MSSIFTANKPLRGEIKEDIQYLDERHRELVTIVRDRIKNGETYLSMANLYLCSPSLVRNVNLHGVWSPMLANSMNIQHPPRPYIAIYTPDNQLRDDIDALRQHYEYSRYEMTKAMYDFFVHFKTNGKINRLGGR